MDNETGRYCHDRGEEHDFDTVRGRMNAARHCLKCPMISLDWDDDDDDDEITTRLEYLRGQIRRERISYGELAELADLADSIDPGDVELLEWAGVPEFPAVDTTSVTVRDDKPAINVKAYAYGASFFDDVKFPLDYDDDGSFTREDLDRLTDDSDTQESLFYAACEDGFEALRDMARDTFGKHVNVWQEGRSGGWAVVEGLGDVEDWNADTLDKWRELCAFAAALVADIPHQMATLAYLNLYEPERERAIAHYVAMGGVTP